MTLHLEITEHDAKLVVMADNDFEREMINKANKAFPKQTVDINIHKGEFYEHDRIISASIHVGLHQATPPVTYNSGQL